MEARTEAGPPATAHALTGAFPHPQPTTLKPHHPHSNRTHYRANSQGVPRLGYLCTSAGLQRLAGRRRLTVAEELRSRLLRLGTPASCSQPLSGLVSERS